MAVLSHQFNAYGMGMDACLISNTYTTVFIKQTLVMVPLLVFVFSRFKSIVLFVKCEYVAQVNFAPVTVMADCTWAVSKYGVVGVRMRLVSG